ncbi:hypothetical protein ABC347_13880 [Sphingomonas sp. 1P06PA]|uniref:hypothetical protein n=1 Tax=Sphingomonas sp. 1P06PA TaxID=554121 RepID=UPI0039A4C9F0
MNWLHIKYEISMATGLAQDALHVHAGILVLLAAALVLRRPVSSPWPWLVVLLIELANEAIDLSNYAPGSRSIGEGGTVRDIWNTMLAPTVLWLAARYTRVFAPRAEADLSDSPPPAAPSPDAVERR